MEKRIKIIKQFQKAMPPKKVVIDEKILTKWKVLLKDFDNKLKEVNAILLEIKTQLYT